MRLATLSDLNEIIRIRNLHRKVLPHLRNDKIKERINDRQVIFQDGVVIIFSIADKMRKIGDDTSIYVSKGSTILHQVFKDNNVVAGGIIKQFLVSQPDDVYCSVRNDNVLAINRYEKLGLERIGHIKWKNGELDGSVYVFRKQGTLKDFIK